MERELSFTHWLKQRRKALDITQHELARLVGCAVITIQQIEGDRRRPSMQMAELLASYLEIPVDQRATFVRLARTHALVPRSALQSHMSPDTRMSVPVPLTSLIGRASEVAAICTYLERPNLRILTLIGPGGIGKTRLALQVAIDLRAAYRDGVCFVPLAALQVAEFVVPAIVSALGFTLHGTSDPKSQLLAYLCAKDMLLVLDNFEHLLTAAPLVSELLADCPDLAVLVTSRAPLRVRGEQQFSVPPLALPPTDDRRLSTADRHRDVVGGQSPAVTHYAAVQLFIQRAQAVQPNFVVTEANALDVAAICHRLDGLPLAIELAAARVKLFNPAALLVRLEQQLSFLTSGPRDAPARQQTLRAAIDWSYNLLNTAEQALFRRLGVFVGGWMADVAGRVIIDEEGQPDRAFVTDKLLDQLATLIDNSLVEVREQADGSVRYTMLETLREYALTQLAAQGELEELRRRHAMIYGMFARHWTVGMLGETSDNPSLVQWAGAELDNLLAALRWAIVERELTVAQPIHIVLTHGLLAQGRLTELAQHNKDLLVPGGLAEHASVMQAQILGTMGWMAAGRGNAAEVRDYGSQFLAVSQALHNPRGIAEAQRMLAQVAILSGTYREAQERLEESLALCQREEDSSGMAFSLLDLGSLHLARGDGVQAEQTLQACLGICRTFESAQCMIRAQTNLVLAALMLNDTNVAVLRLRECLTNRDLPRLAWFTSFKVHAAALLASSLDQFIHAARLLGYATRLNEMQGSVFLPGAHALTIQAIARTRAALSEEAFVAAWAEGRALTAEQAIATALQA